MLLLRNQGRPAPTQRALILTAPLIANGPSYSLPGKQFIIWPHLVRFVGCTGLQSRERVRPADKSGGKAGPNRADAAWIRVKKSALPCGDLT